MSGVYDYSPQFSFTAATNDLITRTAHGLQVNDTLQVYAGGGLPGGLAADTTYYVIASGFTVNDFKVSTSQGGAAVDITSTGTAPNYYASPMNRPLPELLKLPADIVGNGRNDIDATSYQAPPPANKLEAGYVYDTVTGTLAAGGGSPVIGSNIIRGI